MSAISALFFDLDGTLYPHNNGIWGQIAKRMNQYMHERLGLPMEQIPAIREGYFRTYGTTLRGLQIHYEVDPHEYLNYVHDVPVHEYLDPNPALDRMLANISQPKWILTNSDHNHATRTLNALGVAHHFVGILDVIAMDFTPKPDPSVFERALQTAGDLAPEQAVFIDDIPNNLKPAHEMGFQTVLVTLNGTETPYAHHTISDILELDRLLPQWVKAN